MIAEDLTEAREALKLLLKLHGFASLEAADGQTAVAVALAEKPDLILMDLSLPVLDGLQATRAIRAAAAMPIIITSAYDDDDTRAAARAAGADDYVAKPIDFDRLLETIRRRLDRDDG